jgi:aerobic carbon-monoxide dehydrogenase medium subunit
MLPPFSLARPASLAAALDLIGEDAVPYCGGTELLLAMRVGLLRPAALVDLKAVPELSGIQVRRGRLLIGATTTHARLVRHPLVAEHAPFLADVERRVGNPRVRAQGSVGGNLCFGEPRSDLLTALVALRASLVLHDRTRIREIAAENFLNGPYATAREDGELLVCLAVPLPLPPAAVYLKYQITERPTVTVAVAGNGRSTRVVIGAAGEVPVYGDFPLGEIDVAGLVAAVDPVADLSGSEKYKRAMAEVYSMRAITAYLGKVS